MHHGFHRMETRMRNTIKVCCTLKTLLCSVVYPALFLFNIVSYPQYQNCRFRVDIITDGILILLMVWCMKDMICLLSCTGKHFKENCRTRKVASAGLDCSVVVTTAAGTVVLFIICFTESLSCARGGLILLNFCAIFICGISTSIFIVLSRSKMILS